MVYPEEIKGRFVSLKSVTLDDAEFSYRIRAEEKNRKTVGKLAESLEAQEKFIEWQMQQPGDYYFVVYNRKGEKIGLIGIYDIHGDMGEIGREGNDGSSVESMEAEVLVSDFAMDVLGLKKICCVVYKNNVRSLSMIKKTGETPAKEIIRSDSEGYYFESKLTKNDRKRKLLARIKDDFVE